MASAHFLDWSNLPFVEYFLPTIVQGKFPFSTDLVIDREPCLAVFLVTPPSASLEILPGFLVCGPCPYPPAHCMLACTTTRKTCFFGAEGAVGLASSGNDSWKPWPLTAAANPVVSSEFLLLRKSLATLL